MSSEERWIRIENALQTVAERQAHNDVQIEQNAAAIRNLIAHGQQTDQRIDALTRRIDNVTGNVGILAENMIALVHKVDDLSDMVRRREENR